MDDRLSTSSGRKAYKDELERKVEAGTQTLPAEGGRRLPRAKGVPAGVVQNAQYVFDNDDPLRARGYYVYLDHPETGRAAYDGPGMRLSATPGCLRAPAPLLGEHNDYVLRAVLGYGDEEIADLLVEQVVF